jgi:effector-binding domain-containing protein
VLATPAAAVSDVIDVTDANAWYQGALGELHALLAAQKITPTGPGGAIYANDLFSHERGEATVFLPCDGPVRAIGRVTALVVPEAELALTVHPGPHSGDIDRAYGSLATYVTDHALAVEGPIREYYPVGPHETSEETQWRTEIGWPIFDTGHAAHQPPDNTAPAVTADIPAHPIVVRPEHKGIDPVDRVTHEPGQLTHATSGSGSRASRSRPGSQ